MPGALLVTGEYVIGRNLDQRDIGLCAGLAKGRRGHSVDRPCRDDVTFGLVDSGVGRAIDDRGPWALGHTGRDRRGISQIEVREIDRNDFPALRPGASLQFGAELPLAPGHENIAGHAITLLSTVRSFDMLRDPAAFSRLRGDQRAPPILVVEIPLNRLCDAGLKGFGRRPAQFVTDAASVDGIALVMARTVGNRGDLRGVGLAVGAWPLLVKDGAECIDDLDILPLVMAAYMYVRPGWPRSNTVCKART